MKKTLIEKNNGIVQLTLVDERWYIDTNSKTPKFVPSVTWIAGYYPKGIAFYKWLAEKGWDEAEAVKVAAGEKGSKVHTAIVDLVDGKTVSMDSKYVNPTTNKEEELTVEEYECVLAFSGWFKKVQPKVLAREVTVFDDKYNYAGTIDFVCEIAGEIWILDFKTGQNVWPEYELQVSAYKNTFKGVKSIEIHKGKEVEVMKSVTRLGILQVGYKRNKDGYKFNEVEDKFDLFLAAQKIWKNECEGKEPLQKEYPESVSLGIEIKDDEVPF